jgi:hypothetical protein
MQVNLHLANALQIHPPLLGQPARAVTVFRPLHTVEPGRTLKPRVASFLAVLDSAEEPGEGLVEPSQRDLLT